MVRDRSIDEFADVEDGSADAGVDAAGSDPAADAGSDDPNASGSPTAGPSPTTDADDADGDAAEGPPPPTYRWDPDGAACPKCGRVVTERWRHEGSHVCGDCKEW